VPSSSGKGLQRVNPSLPQSIAFIFQSPLHRGRVFNDCGERLAPFIHLSFQSPLHRGRVFNRSALCACSRESLKLSVPSSSGKGLQPSAAWIPKTRSSLSVPSSSGKGLQRRAFTVQGVHAHFQSPLHRGRVFNMTKEIDDDARENNTFSPLFIGEGSSTSVCWADCSADSSFSPLFIGEGSSTQFIPREGFTWDTFSPLFIGEGSSTAEVFRQIMKFADSFSPLFIGEGSSTRSKASTPPTGWHLSVPSSSGKGLQRSLQRGHHGASRAFSPLFIGEGSSTRATRQNKPGLEDFQSPLHRGRVFNDCGERLAPFVHLSFQSPLHRGRVFNLRRYDLEYAKDILSVPS